MLLTGNMHEGANCRVKSPGSTDKECSYLSADVEMLIHSVDKSDICLPNKSNMVQLGRTMLFYPKT